jgi:hypothetical protein
VNVEQLTAVLERTADLMDAATGKRSEGDQVRALADRLRPFAPQTLSQFGDFLALAAGHATGDLAAYFPKTPAKLPKAKTVQPPKATPAELIAQTVQSFRDLYDRALHPDVTPEVIQQAVTGASKLTKPQLDEVTAGCGFQQKSKTKAAALDALQTWVLDRKGAHDRAGA